MTRFRLSLIVLCICGTMYAQQNFQGKAIYQSKTTVDLDNWGNSQLSEERKKQIMERMKSMLEKTFILDFTTAESLYKEEEKLEAPGGGGRGWRFGGGFGGSGVKYKNVKDGQMLESTEFFGKNFLISESMERPEWSLEGETKQIGSYTCFKATLVKKTDEFDWSSMRRRNRNANQEKPKDSTKTRTISEEIEMPKEITVTAWYTPQIPVSNGPAEYWGLPGLILEINAARTTILCSEIIINPEEKAAISAPDKGKEVSREEYNEIVKKKMQEMREMFRSRRGRPRG